MAQKVTILVVGGGGREHAIAWKLAQSPLLGRLYAAPGNAGMAELATCVPVAADDVAGQVKLAQEIGADLVVVGPELPLSLGLVDELRQVGIAAVGPTKAAARIETSKRFAKEVMEVAGIPTAGYHVATDLETAEEMIAAHFAENGKRGTGPHAQSGSLSADATASSPLVLKADGLAAGKGVVICHSEEEALSVARDMLSGNVLGGAGTTLVMEQFLTGPEVSLLAFSDGRRALPMPLAQDYKRLLTGDQGPNTGGMGSISPVPGFDDAMHGELVATVVQPLLDEMARRGTPFQGILFAGLMLTPSGPMVLEYNARFGDPETQSLLRRLESDLLELLLATAAGDLSDVTPVWSKAAAACVVMAAKGYPDDPERGVPIEGFERFTDPRNSIKGLAAVGAVDLGDADPDPSLVGETVVPDSAVVFHGGTARDENGQLVSAGGRVLSVTAIGDDVAQAVERAYAAVGAISFPGSHYRTDIGRI